MARKVYSKNFNRLYKSYRKQYFAQKRKFDKRNRALVKKVEKERDVKFSKEESKEYWKYFMRSDIMSKSDFFTYYDSFKERLEELKGIKPDNQQTVRFIVQKEAYKYTRSQYRGLKEALKDTGSPVLSSLDMDTDFSEIDFRKGFVEISWDILSKEYHYLKEELGYTSDEAKREIAHYYFGSE